MNFQYFLGFCTVRYKNHNLQLIVPLFFILSQSHIKRVRISDTYVHFQSKIFSPIIYIDIHRGTMATKDYAKEDEVDQVDVFYMFAEAEKEGAEPVMSRTKITIA